VIEEKGRQFTHGGLSRTNALLDLGVVRAGLRSSGDAILWISHGERFFVHGFENAQRFTFFVAEKVGSALAVANEVGLKVG